MKRGRRNAAISAAMTIVLSAATALLTGVPAGGQQLSPATSPPTSTATGSTTSTDNELSQLRENQQLLQQRLDQLEQIAQVGPAHPQLPPGTPTIAGSFPRSFLIPGTDTSLLVGGQIDQAALYWLTGGSPGGSEGGDGQIIGVPGTSGVALDIPGNIARSRGNGVFYYSIYDSRLRVETRTPTSFGVAQTVIEIDFLNCSQNGIDCNNTVSGNNGLIPRLRLAYATLGPFAAGQMYNPALDLAAAPETLETGCCAGIFGVGRLPEITYTWPIPPFWVIGGATLAVALIDPADSMMTPNSPALGTSGTLENDSPTAFVGGLPAAQVMTSQTLGTITGSGSNQPLSVNPLKTEFPDPAFALTWQQPWGHLQLHGVVHDADLEDGSYISKHFIGYGGGVSGNVQPAWFSWAKDNITFNAFAGNGLGRYAGGGGGGNYFPYLATNYGAPATIGLPPGVAGNPLGAAVGNPCGYGHADVTPTAACAASVQAQTIPEFGAEASYQHWWTPTIRSTAQIGVSHQDVPTSLIGPRYLQGALGAVNKEIVDANLNLIWSPVPFVNTGFEYVWGHRDTIYNSKGDVNVLLYTFIAKF